MSARLPLRAALPLVLANLLWAASYIAAKKALGDHTAPDSRAFGPFTLAFARFAPAALLLFLYLRLRGERFAIAREDFGRFLLVGLFGFTITYGLFYGALRTTTATEISLLIASEPIFIALLARLLLGERLRRVQSLGMALGFVGVYFIIVQGFVPRLSGTALANAMAVLALSCECYGGIVAKRLTIRYSGLVVLTVEMGVGALTMLPFCLWELSARPLPAPDAATLGGIAYLAVVSSCLCYGIWFSMLSRYDISMMAGFLFIQPVMGPIYGFLFLGERLQFWTACGAALVLLGVWLVASHFPKRRA